MIVGMKRVVIELEYRGIVPVEDAVGTRIDCLRGRIWITQHGCTDDIVLAAGESHEISRAGVAVVQALREALVALRASAVPHAGAGLATRLERLWTRWTAPAAGAHPAVAQPGAG
ncbi:MAG TPA: DUF2917 domain-containing protein [Burkholderiales bacterium]|nr:DUF2917 domain-containing protein [Burkholderiales bacterium]